METLKLAFMVRMNHSISFDISLKTLIKGVIFLQMYESEENGEVQEDDLATILEIMLGVEDVELCVFFMSLDGGDKGAITYGKTYCQFVMRNL